MRQKGMILIGVLLIAALSLLLIFGLGDRLIGARRSGQHGLDTEKAKSLAESALHFALANINRDPDWKGKAERGLVIEVTTPAKVPTQGHPFFDLVTPDPADWRQILVRVEAGAADATLTGLAQAVYHAPFRAALFGTDDVRLQDVTTDSFKGAYHDSFEERWGALGSGGSIVIHPAHKGIISGDARPGPTGGLTIEPNQVEVRGYRKPYPRPFKWPNVRPPLDAKPLVLKDDRPNEVPPGTYRIPELRIKPEGRLVTRGPVTIHVSGNVEIPFDGWINETKRPADALLWVAGSEVEVWVPFAGAIYAPDATLTIKGDGDFWGAVTAKRIVSHGDLKLHLDQAIIPQTRGQRVEFRLRHWFHSL